MRIPSTDPESPSNERKGCIEMDNWSEFLLKEYESTSQALLNNADRAHKITGLFQLVNAGLIALIVALVGFLKESQSGPSLEKLGILLPCFSLLSLGAALVGLLIVVYILRLRFRDIWCYNRMNLIRRIFLENTLGDALKAYITSPYGTTESYQMTPRRFFRSDTFINTAIVAVVSCSWAAIGGFLWPTCAKRLRSS
jgi:hypothetical protein